MASPGVGGGAAPPPGPSNPHETGPIRPIVRNTICSEPEHASVTPARRRAHFAGALWRDIRVTFAGRSVYITCGGSPARRRAYFAGALWRALRVTFATSCPEGELADR